MTAIGSGTNIELLLTGDKHASFPTMPENTSSSLLPCYEHAWVHPGRAGLQRGDLQVPPPIHGYSRGFRDSLKAQENFKAKQEFL